MFVVKNGVRFLIRIFKIFPEKILNFSIMPLLKNFPEKILAFSNFSPLSFFVSFFRFIDKLSLGGGLFIYNGVFKKFSRKIFGFLKIGSSKKAILYNIMSRCLVFSLVTTIYKKKQV